MAIIYYSQKILKKLLYLYKFNNIFKFIVNKNKS